MRNIGLVFFHVRRRQNKRNGHKLAEESRWVCIKGIPCSLTVNMVLYIFQKKKKKKRQHLVNH